MSMLEEAENGDNVDSSQDDEEKEEVMDVEDTSLDKELPVDSFFASGDAVGMSNIATIVSGIHCLITTILYFL